MNNQLRIGSIVGFRSEGELLPSIVTSISADHITVQIIDNPYEDLSDHQYVENWEPIRMTPEWLEKFGFEKFTDDKSEHNGNYIKSLDIHSGWLVVSGDYSVGIKSVHPAVYESFYATDIYPFVHQFQNLIHALKNNYDA